MNENITNKESSILLEKNITDKQIKFFSWLFSQVPKKITTNIWVREIYDIATQYFIYWTTNLPIYWDFQYKTLTNKIVKTVWGDFLESDKISETEINEFRKYFYKNPEFQEIIKQNFSDWSELKVFNEFIKYTIEYKILEDKHLNGIREVRKYIYMSNDSSQSTWDIRQDLYNFLNIQRFAYYQNFHDEANKLIDEITIDVKNWIIDNPLDFKCYKDRNKFPDRYITQFEKLILKNYTYDPITKKEKVLVTDYVNNSDLDFLKKITKFNPVWWQRRALVMESRENLAANCRRSGKTRLAVYIAVRQLMLPQQTILYIIPNKEWFSEQPFKYIEEMFDNIKMMADIEWNIPWFQFNNKTFKITNKEKNSKIIFLSAVWGTKWGRSFSAHLIIMDESWYIEDQDMYHVSSDATADTRWRMWAISTINKDIPINRFFYKKIDLDWADDWQVISVNIYENDFIPDEEKLKKERDLKIKYPNLWLSEWMAIFVGQWDTFDISGFFRLDFDYDVLKFWDFSFRFSKKLDKYTRFIIWRDPWRDTDPAWISVIGIKNKNDADLIATWYMRVPNYIIQKNTVVELFNFLKKMKDTIIVIDTGKAGIWMFDLMNSEQIYPYWVMSTASWVINQRSPREYNIWNNVLEWNLKNIMNNWTLKWYSWLDDIRHEYETFEASKTRSWTKHHHDILSSLMIATTIWLERNFLSFRKEDTTKSDISLKEVFDDFFWDNKTNTQSSSKFLY